MCTPFLDRYGRQRDVINVDRADGRFVEPSEQFHER